MRNLMGVMRIFSKVCMSQQIVKIHPKINSMNYVLNKQFYSSNKANFNSLDVQINSLYEQLDKGEKSNSEKLKILDQIIEKKSQRYNNIRQNEKDSRKKYQGYNKDLLEKAQLLELENNQEQFQQIMDYLLQLKLDQLAKEYDTEEENFGFISELYINAGIYYKKQDNSEKALEYCFRLKDIQYDYLKNIGVKFDDPQTYYNIKPELIVYYGNFISENIQNIAFEYTNQGDLDKAIDYLNMIGLYQNEILNIFKQIIESQQKGKKYDTEFKEDQAKELFAGFLLKQADTFMDISSFCLETGKLDVARELQQASINFYKYLYDVKRISESNLNYLFCQFLDLKLNAKDQNTEDYKQKYENLRQQIQNIKSSPENQKLRFNFRFFELEQLKDIQSQIEKLKQIKEIVDEDNTDIENRIIHDNFLLKIQIQLKNFDSSLNTARDIISILKQNNRRFDQIYVDTIIAMGEISVYTNNNEEASQLLDEALELSQNKNQLQYLEVLRGKANVLKQIHLQNSSDIESKDNSLKFYLRAEEIAKELEAQQEIPTLTLQIQEEIANYFEVMQNYEEAKIRLNLCLSLINKHFPMSIQKSQMIINLNERINKLK